VLLRRLGRPPATWAPLRVLVDLVEPVKGYNAPASQQKGTTFPAVDAFSWMAASHRRAGCAAGGVGTSTALLGDCAAVRAWRATGLRAPILGLGANARARPSICSSTTTRRDCSRLRRWRRI